MRVLLMLRSTINKSELSQFAIPEWLPGQKISRHGFPGSNDERE